MDIDRGSLKNIVNTKKDKRFSGLKLNSDNLKGNDNTKDVYALTNAVVDDKISNTPSSVIIEVPQVDIKKIKKYIEDISLQNDSSDDRILDSATWLAKKFTPL